MRTFRVGGSDLSSKEIVETLLVESGASKKLPTDECGLLAYLGLRQLQFDFMNELDFLQGGGPPAKDLRAALVPGDKLVAVQSGMGEKRSRFSVLHEVAHFILPDHRPELFLDTDKTLSWVTRIRLEKEANQAAADLLFQGDRFRDESVDCELSLQTVLDLAPRFGASYEASARRFAQYHVLPCALLVYDKVSRTNEVDYEEDTYEHQYTIASETFKKEYFSSVTCSPNRFSAAELCMPKGWGQITQGELVVKQDDRKKWSFETDIFSNGYKIFQLVKREAKQS